ncbi:MAG: hypothetical protein L0G37_01835 [Pseudomonas sp.]|uniref:Uncharacterized protein n=1 Tax=Pseudomonas gessardii TaxID=78544 RepID=A0A7Y1MQD4_9PSED|nr:hypothetical protein [Pseudomonas gessardii]MDN5397988.1 hypothetical protein [Pseudomonas sp.]MDN5419745.1 hypothetical protein [Pseudomonadales bacterium]MDN5429918.1 hypothetical protein [Pseudomonadales bacterium]NNA96370.1 hypothetical protein [Pseudomonas gessardii]
MSKGAKPGQNRFAGSQKRKRDYRIARIKDEIIPQLKAFAGKVSFDGVTPFSRFCAELYNTDLPVNEKKIGYRTLVQSSDYWSLIGPIYYKHWDPSDNLESKKEMFVGKLAAQRADHLGTEVERLKKENDALRSALRGHGATPTPLPETTPPDQGFISKFDKTCRALKLVLDASDGMFAVDLSAKKIVCAFNDLEPLEGLVPKELAEPFVAWMNTRGKNHG